MEEEHRRIISTKMKLAVHRRLHPEIVDSDKDMNRNDDSPERLHANQNPSEFSGQKSVQVPKYSRSLKYPCLVHTVNNYPKKAECEHLI